MVIKTWPVKSVAGAGLTGRTVFDFRRDQQLEIRNPPVSLIPNGATE
jgi:hypothetical protein